MNSQLTKFTAIALFAAGLFVGSLTSSGQGISFARADERKPPIAFQSGAQRSLVLLERISKQIESIDNRLERIEKAASSGSSPNRPKRR